jgi:hypothetical protein
LHTLIPDSRLSNEKKALVIVYAWGKGSASDPGQAIKSMSISSELVVVHANELFEGWRLGVPAFAKDLEHDPARKTRVKDKAAKFFLEWDTAMMRDANALLNEWKVQSTEPEKQKGK